ncbi:hypothetical protein FRC03_004229 [Tulasnella sp. 419]|nr:hypothetical protein FRC03_004229 [Tulasnella sp. 419]
MSVEVSRSNGLAAQSSSPVLTIPPSSDVFYPTGGGAKVLIRMAPFVDQQKQRFSDESCVESSNKNGIVWSMWMWSWMRMLLVDGQMGMVKREASENGSSVGGNGSADGEEAEMAMRMKQERAKLQFAEADWVRSSALQEAAFYRAKLSLQSQFDF